MKILTMEHKKNMVTKCVGKQSQSTKLVICVAVLLLAFVVFSSSAAALGVKPASMSYVRDSTQAVTLEKSFTVTLDAAMGQDTIILLSAHGPLANYIQLPANRLVVDGELDEYTINYVLSLPANYQLRDEQSYIGIQAATDGQSLLTSNIALKHNVHVEGPHLGKRISSRLLTRTNTDTVSLIAEVTNIGQRPLLNLSTIFTLKDQDGNLVFESDTPAQELLLTNTTTFVVDVPRSIATDDSYVLSADIMYDGFIHEKHKEVLVGTAYITPVSFAIDTETNSDVLPYTFTVRNKWGKDLDLVDAKLQFVLKETDNALLQAQEQQTQLTKKTISLPQFTLTAYEEKDIEYFLDRSDLVAGEYEAVLVLSSPQLYAQSKKTYDLVLPRQKNTLASSVDSITGTASGFFKQVGMFFDFIGKYITLNQLITYLLLLFIIVFTIVILRKLQT